jgi:hypothetical protein
MNQPLAGFQRSRLILVSLFPNALTHTTSVCILASPNYSADLLSDNISHDSKAATPAEFSASIQIAPSSSLLWGDNVRPVGTVSPSSIVAATPCKRRLTTSGTGSSNVNTPASLRSGDMHQQNLLHLIQRGAYVSSTIADEISPHSMGTAKQSMRTARHCSIFCPSHQHSRRIRGGRSRLPESGNKPHAMDNRHG